MSSRLKREAAIAKILGKIEKIEKDKYWLLEQIRRRDRGLQITPAMTTYEMLASCPNDLIFRLDDYLAGIDARDDIPRFAETYHWFFTDLVASSSPDITVDDQALKIVELNKLIQKTPTFRNRDQSTTFVLPTGDGNAIGFKDYPEKPLLLAIELHKVLSEYNRAGGRNPKKRIEIRIGLSTGPVYRITDLQGNPNVWGPGIIYARRVMDLGRSKSILATDTFANEVQRLKPDFKNIMRLIGNYQIKHEVIPVYNISGITDGVEFGTSKKPLPKPQEESMADKEFAELTNTFVFTSIEIILDIRDPKTMLTHHTWIWHMVNQSDKPVDRVFYYLEGDTDRDFSELNVKVTDEDGKELPVKSLNVNKPHKKEFFMQLFKPFKPQQAGKFVKLEYDWEEPEKQFQYTFASGCKKFRFLLRAPKGMPVSHKVARVAPNIGEKVYSSKPAAVRYLSNRTEVEWTASNIPAFDAYRFDW